MKDRPILSIGECIQIIYDVECITGVKCKRYGAYDRKTGVFLEAEHYINTHYTHNINIGYAEYLLKHNGQIYFPALIKGEQLAFIAVFDTVTLYEKYGEPKKRHPNATKGQIDLETYMNSIEKVMV